VGESEAGRQFAALSSALDRTAAFGIAPGAVFGFEDWVGGRYSIWGPIGLSLMIAIGPRGLPRLPAPAGRRWTAISARPGRSRTCP
jgi:glucose-6-phosphate isomerase